MLCLSPSRTLKSYTTLVLAGMVFCAGPERGWANCQDRATESESTTNVEYRTEAVVRTADEFIIWVPHFVRAELRGYRVYPKGDRRFYESLGLEAGNVVIAIDGKSFTDSAQANQLFRRILDGKQVTLTVQRNGLSEVISIPAN